MERLPVAAPNTSEESSDLTSQTIGIEAQFCIKMAFQVGVERMTKGSIAPWSLE